MARNVATLVDPPAVKRPETALPLSAEEARKVMASAQAHQLAMFLAPYAIGGFFILLFAVTLKDRRLAKADKPTWSVREFASTFYVNPRKNPDFAWAFTSRFMLVLAYAFLTTYQAYYLLDKIGSAETDVPQQIFLGTLVQSAVVVVASLLGGRLSDRTGRRKIFVLTASIVYGLAIFVVAVASDFNGFLVGMAISGLGFGLYMAVDLALVATCCRTRTTSPRISVFSTWPARFPSPSHQASRLSSWPSVVAVTASCSPSPAPAPSPEPQQCSPSRQFADDPGRSPVRLRS